MNLTNIKDKFELMGARLKTDVLRQRPWDRRVNFTVDVKTDKNGEYFELLVRPNADPEFMVADVKPKDRHLLLLAKDVDLGKPMGSNIERHRLLCGHDERAWFVAGIPRGVSSVNEAKEALKPAAVKASLAMHHVKTKLHNKRKNPGFVRQGEWFFVPRPDLRIDEVHVLRNEPLSRGAGKPHMAEFLCRRGGTLVHVCRDFQMGLREQEYVAYIRAHPEKAKLSWHVMTRNPEAYVKGKIRHPDHKTVFLPLWHRVVPNAEDHFASGRNVAFLD